MFCSQAFARDLKCLWDTRCSANMAQMTGKTVQTESFRCIKDIANDI